MAKRTTACPCGSARPYEDCCAPVHQGTATAATAAALMRSRFSAFALGDAGYLLRSWHSRTRPERLELDRGTRWIRLEVLETGQGGLFDSTGTVRFRAHYREGGRPGVLAEHSRFAREDGRWVYLDALLE
ncbi:YchJ family metal-binding protein [Micromonospora sp. WMMD1128]|uniref:YchJ family protein n=1 Tax=unclassified Micromonospora TaxID=2617518 RepID=UPI00248C00BC|nr:MULTISPECIES: YchJ family metal-binding protein [unclassified Micromonospora]WBB76427.1 YchJ family metal-binding protein [Micromonospora sp. WMMD1128]WFE35790.1 YchJ family metal-binding protein [Micromonospora sp. WMMD975]